MALNLKTSRNSPMSVPSEYVSVDLTKDDEDAPVDLSCPSRQSRTDLIPLEKLFLDEDNLNELNIKTKDDLNKYIEKIQAELRIEEVNLILLQKIKTSHQKDIKSSHESNGVHADKLGNSNSKQQSSKMQNGTLPKKGSQAQQQTKYGGTSSTTAAKGSGIYQHSTHNSSKTVAGNQVSQPQASSRYQQQSTFQVNGAGHQQSSPIHQLQLHEQQRKLLQQQQQAATVLVEQTAARRLAAAKLAVQKNLERDLVRTPGPRASPFDLSVIPNPSCPQFISLLGLEQAVDRLLTNENLKPDGIDSTSKEVSELKKTSLITCARCSTDFTPKWVERMSKTGTKVCWCENCYRVEKKRIAGKHQEEKLNSAFAKAAQQERDMEKALAAELEAAKQQLDAIILPNTNSPSFRTTSVVVPSARNSPVAGASRSHDKQTAKVVSSSPASQLTSQPKQQVTQKQPQQKSRLPQTTQNAKSILAPHAHQQPPLDLERLMLYNEKMGAMFKQLAGGEQSLASATSLFKDRSSVKQNISGSRHAPYSRP